MRDRIWFYSLAAFISVFSPPLIIILLTKGVNDHSPILMEDDPLLLLIAVFGILISFVAGFVLIRNMQNTNSKTNKQINTGTSVAGAD